MTPSFPPPAAPHLPAPPRSDVNSTAVDTAAGLTAPDPGRRSAARPVGVGTLCGPEALLVGARGDAEA